jgi:hypothetical protein
MDEPFAALNAEELSEPQAIISHAMHELQACQPNASSCRKWRFSRVLDGSAQTTQSTSA